MNSESTTPWSTEEFREILREIARTRMPFGRYGPEKHPPAGLPIRQLPLEYLLWMKERSFPRGRLGKLLESVCQIKEAGCGEILFAPGLSSD